MVQDAVIRNLLTASIAFLIFFFLMRSYWRAALHRSSKSPADLPGGDWAFNAYLLAQTLLYALTLTALMTAMNDHGYDFTSWDLWKDFGIVLLYAITIIFSVNYGARRIWPSIKRIDAVLAEASKNGRRETQAGK